MKQKLLLLCILASMGGKGNDAFPPIHILNFQVNKYSGYCELRWQTMDEVNAKFFEIESSSDGVSFTAIGTVKAGAAGIVKDYFYKDFTNTNGIVYYRIKMVNVTGFIFSEIIKENGYSRALLNIYPNPVKDLLTISTGNNLMGGKVTLTSADGIVIKEVKIQQLVTIINMSNCGNGLYVIKVGNDITQKIIKK